MKYNTPFLMNVATAFDVVLGIGSVDEEDHSTDNGCEDRPLTNSTTPGGC